MKSFAVAGVVLLWVAMGFPGLPREKSSYKSIASRSRRLDEFGALSGMPSEHYQEAVKFAEEAVREIKQIRSDIEKNPAIRRSKAEFGIHRMNNFQSWIIQEYRWIPEGSITQEEDDFVNSRISKMKKFIKDLEKVVSDSYA